MTKEEIMVLDMEGVQARGAEIIADLETCDESAIEERKLEMDMLEERKKAIELEAIEKRAKMLEVIEGAGEIIEESKEEKKKMTNIEVRNSKEYIDAFVEYVKKGYDLEKVNAERRALLTENATDYGTIAVPTYIAQRIETAWENDELMRRVRRTFVPGNLKVGAEVSATGAVVHAEGGDPIDPEDLVITYIDLIPEYLKKMVEVSHTAMALTGTAFLDYLYDEIEYQIVKLAGAQAIDAMLNSALSATSTLSGATATAADIIQAEGELGGQAANAVLIMTRSTAADLKAAALSAGYGYDPFDGMPVIYVDAAALQGAAFIIADLSGVQANFPEGDDVRFIFDELTKAPENIVRIIGRLLVAVNVIAGGKVVIGAAEASA